MRRSCLSALMRNFHVPQPLGETHESSATYASMCRKHVRRALLQLRTGFLQAIGTQIGRDRGKHGLKRRHSTPTPGGECMHTDTSRASLHVIAHIWRASGV